jgi:peptide deformylase
LPVREVLQLGHPMLREVAEPVKDPGSAEVAALVADLKDTLAHWRRTTGYGRAIAAPQIGARKRVVFLNLGEPWPMVNPAIIERSEETMVVWDACLSFLFVFCRVVRHREVRVRYQDLEGAWYELGAGVEDDLSELLQHEIDHLDGILAVDRMVSPRTLCSREEFEKRHKAESLYASAVGASPTKKPWRKRQLRGRASATSGA